MKTQKLLRTSLLVAALASSYMAMAYNVTATVTDPQGYPCINAVYHIYADGDTIRPIINNITNEEGVLDQRLASPGKYAIKIEYVGLTPASRTFEVSDASPSAQLGNLVLSPADNMLQEVVVTIKKPVVVSDGANITYNVAEDPASTTSSILELLRHVPMVTVDGQDNIRVNGSTDFKIYLNGRSNPMFSSDPQRVLKAMPASMIKKIEVLTEPGAKYEAEGSGGILNIITETGSSKNMENGYAGSLSAGAGAQRWEAGAFLRAKVGRVTGSASVNHSQGYGNRSGDTTQEILYNDGSRLENIMTMPRQNKYRFTGGNISLSWEPDDKNLFTATVNMDNINGGQNIRPNISTTYDTKGDVVSRLRQDMMFEFKRLGTSVNTSYQHNFDSEGNDLTVTYQYAMSRTDMNVDQNMQALEPVPADAMAFRTDNTNRDNEHTVQIDWSKPIGQKHMVETGARGVFRRNTAKTISTQTADDQKTDLMQYQDIAAVYATYTGHYGRFTLTPGLRYEFTRMGIDFRTPGYDNFCSRLHDLVPNLSLSYSITPMQTWRLAYSMRISRPTVDQVNPAETMTTPQEIRMGNPDLESQKSHTISLAYSQFSQKVSFNVRLSYKFTDNMISDYTYVDPESRIMYSTYANMGRSQQTTLSGFVNYNITSAIQVGANGEVSYVDYNAPSLTFRSHGWQGNVGGNASWTAPKGFRLSAFGGWAGRQYQIQGWFSGWYYYGIGVTKSLLAERLELSVNAMNMLQKYNTFEGKSFSNDAVSTFSMKHPAWNVGFSIKWNFGSLKSQVKQTKAVIDNADSVETGNSKSGMGGSPTGGM